MAGRGPAPKPAHLRQRRNKKVGASEIVAPLDPNVPPLPNPDGRVWHPLTLEEWGKWWRSEMASKWLSTDVAGLAMLAVLYDNFYKEPGDIKALQEIRLQRQAFGLTPLDRSRLQWEVSRGEEAERKRQRPQPARRTGTADPRAILMAVK